MLNLEMSRKQHLYGKQKTKEKYKRYNKQKNKKINETKTNQN